MSNIKTDPLDWFNFISQSYNSNALIQYVLTFGKPIDFLLLRDAVEDCMLRVPRLACRFEENGKGAIWTTAEHSPAATCNHMLCDDMKHATREILSIPIDVTKEPPIQLHLLQCGVSQQRLVLKMHHAVSDAMGGLLLVRMLTQSYMQAMDKDKHYTAIRIGTYTPSPLPTTPEPNLTGILNHFAACQSPQDDHQETECDPIWHLPTCDDADSQGLDYCRSTLSKQDTTAVKAFAAAHGSDLNATLTAAYYLAILHLTNPTTRPHTMQFTMDLRRYDDTMRHAVGNLSTILNADLPQSNDFDTLVGEVKQSLDRAMQDDHVAPMVLATRTMEQIGLPALTQHYASDWEKIQRTGCSIPMISNLGILDKQPIAFDTSTVKELFVVPPAFLSPSMLLAPNSYGGILSLIVSFRPSPANKLFAKKLIEHMKTLLLSAIGRNK